MFVLDLDRFQQFYLVGIKGVAMASMAQLLIDAGKTVRGCDVAEDFVTADVLKSLTCQVDIGFDHPLPPDTECVIYTAAHHGKDNPIVRQAAHRQIPTASHAEALGYFFNQKQGIAVCGVGGKSTTSAMVAWILEQTNRKPSFAIGVGKIIGLSRTGQWRTDSDFFVAEADEYVTDASAPARGEAITPRFSYLAPQVTICTNLEFDHPDVYTDFEHTKAVFRKFFRKIKERGELIINADNQNLVELVDALQPYFDQQEVEVWSFGESSAATVQLLEYRVGSGSNTAQLKYQQQIHTLELFLPGKFNIMNALAALTACLAIGIPIEESITALRSFRSTTRRFEYIGEKHGVKYYDDYAHHPHEVAAVIKAINEWYPDRHVVIAFQSHTFSRTKQLFAEFVEALSTAKEVAMIDIFPSAREAYDPSVTSTQLCERISAHHPDLKAINYGTLPRLAEYLRSHLKPGDVCLTVGAGDIYHLHELM
jgi:UDP-N-acetylmuramate--alanine ligase